MCVDRARLVWAHVMTSYIPLTLPTTHIHASADVLHTHPVAFFPFQPSRPIKVYYLQHTQTQSHTPQLYTSHMISWKEVKVQITDPYIFLPIQE